MDSDFVRTRGSLSKRHANIKHTSVIYKDYKAKGNKSANHVEEEVEAKDSALEFNIKRARQDVIRFGMGGFDTKTQEEAKIKAAINLGAKPPKKKNINYKQLLADRKAEESKAKETDGFLQIGKNKAGNSTAVGKSYKKKRKMANKKKLDITDNYGKVKIAKK